MRLLPMYLYLFERHDDYANMDKYHIMDCIECGACTYSCPARLHLTHSCRTGKAKMTAKRNAEKAAAEAAKAKAEAEKAAKEAGKEGK